MPLYKLVNLRDPDTVIDQSTDLIPLFKELQFNHVIVKGKRQEIVAGMPTNLLDTMSRELAHTLPELLAVYGKLDHTRGRV